MTEISRRLLIGAGAAGAVAGVLGPAPAEAAVRPRVPRTKKFKKQPNLYSRARFLPHRDATFSVTGAEGSASMVLAAITDLPSTRAGADGCFALTFRSASEGPPQGTYTFRRRGFTATTMFMVPSDASRRTYQVVVFRG
jgi:hypothetical protein